MKLDLPLNLCNLRSKKDMFEACSYVATGYRSLKWLFPGNLTDEGSQGALHSCDSLEFCRDFKFKMRWLK